MSQGTNNLPGNWVWTTIGEVIEPRVEQAAPEGNGQFLYVDISSIDNHTKKINDPKNLAVANAPSRARQRLKADDVLVSMTRPNLNAVSIVPSEMDGAIGSTGFDVLRTAWINPRWLLYLVQIDDFIHAMSRQVQGVLYPAVRPKEIRSYRIPLAPLPEQRRILAEIEKQFTRLEAAVAALKRVQANLKRYRAAVLKAAVEGRLVPTEASLARAQGRSYEPASELLKRILAERRARWEADQAVKLRTFGKLSKNLTSNQEHRAAGASHTNSLPTLPEGWAWCTIGQITGDAVIGLDRGRSKQSTAFIGAPYVKMNNVSMDGRVSYDSMVYVEVSAAEADRFTLRDGDLLFNTRNSVELVGKAGLVRCPPERAVFNNNLMRIRLVPAITPEFICAQMCSGAFRKRLETVKRATTNVAAVYAKDLFPLPIALPPVAEQERIMAEAERRLSIIDEQEMQVETNLKRAERLRQAILKRAFEGKLVPQDPDDEPASVLLERIRAERSTATPGCAKSKRTGRSAGVTE